MTFENLKIMITTYKFPNQVIKYEINMINFQNMSSEKSRVQPPTNEIKSIKSTTVWRSRNGSEVETHLT